MPDPGLSDTLPVPTDISELTETEGESERDTEQDKAAMEMFFCGKSAGRPREADKEARAENLLYTAGCLFLEKGYGKVSLEMIARQAHVAVRTIYVKFGGKSGLFNAVVEQRRAAYFSTMPALETDMRPLLVVLSEFGLLFLKLITMPAAVRLNRMIVAEAASHPELAETFHKVGPGRTRDMLIRFFSRPEIAAQFRTALSAEQLAVHLLNCLLDDQMSRLLFPPLTQPDTAQLRKLLEHRLDLFLRATLRTPLAA